MSSRKNVDALALSFILLISIVWGGQLVSIKAVSSDMSPMLQIALRSGIAVALLVMIMRFKKIDLVCKHTWKPGLLAGALLSLEYYLVGEALRYSSASHVIVFLYSAPIFVALILHFTTKSERLSPIQWLGVGLAFFGIVLALLWNNLSASNPATQATLWGNILALFGAVSWAVTTVVVRVTTLSNAPATQTLLYQLAVCFLVLIVIASGTEQISFTLSPSLISNLIFQGVIVTFGSFLLWFWLLRQYSASQLGISTFMTPILGVLFSIWLLDEPLEMSFVWGAISVVLGLFLVNAKPSVFKRTKKLLLKVI